MEFFVCRVMDWTSTFPSRRPRSRKAFASGVPATNPMLVMARAVTLFSVCAQNPVVRLASNCQPEIKEFAELGSRRHPDRRQARLRAREVSLRKPVLPGDRVHRFQSRLPPSRVASAGRGPLILLRRLELRSAFLAIGYVRHVRIHCFGLQVRYGCGKGYLGWSQIVSLFSFLSSGKRGKNSVGRGNTG